MARPFAVTALAAVLSCARGTSVTAADASLDASATGDAGVAPEAWSAIPAMRGCTLRFRDAPKGGPTGLVWSGCGAACNELVASMPGAAVTPTARAMGSHTSAGTKLFVRMAPVWPSRQRYVLGAPDGPAELVMETDCPVPKHGAAPQAASYGVGEDGAFLEIAERGDSSFFAGPFSNDPTWRAPAAAISTSLLGETILVQPPTVEARSMRAVDARGRVLRSDPATGTMSAAFAHARATLRGAVARGDVTLFVAETIPESIAIEMGDTTPATWLAPGSGGGVSAVARDGGDAYFLQGAGRDKNNVYASIDLYRAPFPTAASTPSSTKVATTSLHAMTDPVAGAGSVAFRSSERSVDVVVTAGPRTVRFTAPFGFVASRIVTVDAEELFVEVAVARAGMTAPARTLRVPIGSLPGP